VFPGLSRDNGLLVEGQAVRSLGCGFTAVVLGALLSLPLPHDVVLSEAYSSGVQALHGFLDRGKGALEVKHNL
jgi:hypothetical protein